jgi:hypothetical protein
MSEQQLAFTAWRDCSTLTMDVSHHPDSLSCLKALQSFCVVQLPTNKYNRSLCKLVLWQHSLFRHTVVAAISQVPLLQVATGAPAGPGW